jgi:hypothetical protein
MRPRGEDTVSALYDWVKEEIKKAPAIRHDLGKFFFAVTTGTVGVIISVEKLSGSTKVDKSLGISLVCFFAAIIVALLMAIPKVWNLTGETDLFHEYNLYVKRIIQFIVAWFLIWLLGTVFGIYALLDV